MGSIGITQAAGCATRNTAGFVAVKSASRRKPAGTSGGFVQVGKSTGRSARKKAYGGGFVQVRTDRHRKAVRCYHANHPDKVCEARKHFHSSHPHVHKKHHHKANVHAKHHKRPTHAQRKRHVTTHKAHRTTRQAACK